MATAYISTHTVFPGEGNFWKRKRHIKSIEFLIGRQEWYNYPWSHSPWLEGERERERNHQEVMGVII